jgi:uncharacterized protein (TIGR03435 family)
MRSKLGYLFGGPDWVKTDMWDLQASIVEGLLSTTAASTFPSGNPPAWRLWDPKLRQMLQTLLADRFKLVIRRETREMPTYLLKVGKDGPKFNGIPPDLLVIRPGQEVPKPFPPGIRGVWQLGPDGGSLSTMRSENGVLYRVDDVIEVSMVTLARILTGTNDRVVIDQTGLTGTYSYHLETANDGIARPRLEKAIEQVGLRLEESKAPMEVWVIERAEKPAEN